MLWQEPVAPSGARHERQTVPNGELGAGRKQQQALFLHPPNLTHTSVTLEVCPLELQVLLKLIEVSEKTSKATTKPSAATAAAAAGNPPPAVSRECCPSRALIVLMMHIKL